MSDQPILKLCKDIAKLLPTTSLQDITYLVDLYKADDWQQYLKTSNTRYTASKIYSKQDIEVFIISWLPGQFANVHNHSKNGYILKVLTGQLREKIFTEAITLVSERDLLVGSISFMSDMLGLHSISNNTETLTVSLHIYSPTHNETKFF